MAPLHLWGRVSYVASVLVESKDASGTKHAPVSFGSWLGASVSPYAEAGIHFKPLWGDAASALSDASNAPLVCQSSEGAAAAEVKKEATGEKGTVATAGAQEPVATARSTDSEGEDPEGGEPRPWWSLPVLDAPHLDFPWGNATAAALFPPWYSPAGYYQAPPASPDDPRLPPALAALAPLLLLLLLCGRSRGTTRKLAASRSLATSSGSTHDPFTWHLPRLTASPSSKRATPTKRPTGGAGATSPRDAPAPNRKGEATSEDQQSLLAPEGIGGTMRAEQFQEAWTAFAAGGPAQAQSSFAGFAPRATRPPTGVNPRAAVPPG